MKLAFDRPSERIARPSGRFAGAAIKQAYLAAG